jgi:prepilin-type N-terminal cleavage/methylation domain-containing protein/prepilin-type processing-associated H-X9-DG protein
MKPLAFRPERRPGFTLIELLMVLSVIAILTALLFPVFMSARRAAYRTVCGSNIRQLNQALLLYAGDYDDTFIRWNNGWPDGVWDTVLLSYVKNTAVYHCPANPKSLPGTVARSYALPRNVSGVNMAAVPRPTDTVTLYDKGGEAFGARGDSTGEFFAQTYGPYDTTLWHEGGKYFSFMDGHVRFWKVGMGPWAYDFAPPQGNNDYGPGYCGGQLNTTQDDDGGPGKNLPP